MTRIALTASVGTFARTGPVDDPAASPPMTTLEFATPTARRVAAALTRLGYEVRERPNVGHTALGSAMRRHTRQQDPSIVYYLGHARVDPTTRRLYLVARDTMPGSFVTTGVDVCAHFDEVDDAPQGSATLFILDTCHAGRAVSYLNGQDKRDRERRAWVLASTHAADPALSGRFSVALATVLERLAAGLVDIAPSERHVRLEKVRDLVQTELSLTLGLAQEIQCTSPASAGEPPPFILNPGFDTDAAERYDQRVRAVPDPATRALLDEVADPEHFRTRAAGGRLRRTRTGGAGLARCLFTGRSSVLEQLVAWLSGSAQEPGRLRVVTGSPGAGKSAVLGAIVCASHPILRTQAPELTSRLTGPRRPPTLAYQAIIHARDRSATEILTSIAAQLDLGEEPVGGWTAQAITAAIRADAQVPVVTVDGLDEAIHPNDVAESVLLPLHREGVAKILVGVRSWRDRYHPLPLLTEQGVRLIDLDDTPVAVLRNDLTEYLVEVLQESPHYGESYDLRRTVAESAAEMLTVDRDRRGTAFLAASLFADHLDSLPAAISDPSQLRAAVPDSLDKLLELRLRHLSDDAPALRSVLATLARAKGAGMPRTIVTAAARAFLANRPDVTEPEVAAALDSARFYLRRGVDTDGTVLYRLFHQAFNDRLTSYPMDPDRPAADPIDDAGRLFEAMLPLRRGDRAHAGLVAWERAEPYLRRHAAGHAADAGCLDGLLTDLNFLAYADPDLLYPYLNAATDDRAVSLATVYRTSAHLHRHGDPIERRDLLLADLARWGLPPVRARHQRPAPAIGWATGSHLHGAIYAQMSGHEAEVSTVATTIVAGIPVAITGGDDATVRVWNLATALPNGPPLTGHTELITTVATADIDGQPVAISAGWDNTLLVWGLTTGALLRRIPQPDIIHAVAVALLDGRPVTIAACDDLTLRLNDLMTGELIGVLGDGHQGTINAVAIVDLNGTPAAVTASSDRTLRVWDLPTRRAVGDPLTGHTDAVRAVATAVVNARPVAVSGSSDRTVRVWDLQSGAPIGTPLSGHADGVDAVATATVGGRPIAVTGSRDTTLRLWDLSTNQAIGDPLTDHHTAITAIAITRLGTRAMAVTGSWDNRVRVWELAAGPATGNRRIGHMDAVVALATTRIRGRDTVVSTGSDATLRRWDLATGDSVGQPTTVNHTGVSAIATARISGRPVGITGGLDGMLQTWDLLDGRPASGPVLAHQGAVAGVGEADPRTRRVVTGGIDGILRMWDATTLRAVGTPIATDQPITALGIAWLGGRTWAITGGPDGSLRVWDLQRRLPVGDPLSGHTDQVTAVALALLDGRPVAVTGSWDATVRLWDIPTGRAVGEPLVGHDAVVNAVTTREWQRRLVAVTGSSDRTVRIWDVRTGQQLTRAIHLPDKVSAVAVGAYRRLIVGIGPDIAVLTPPLTSVSTRVSRRGPR